MMDSKDRERLNRLSGEIRDIRRSESVEKDKAGTTERDAANMNTGARAGAELIGLTLAGAGIGYGLDHVFHTTPVFLVVFVLAGIGLGFYEVYRIAK